MVCVQRNTKETHPCGLPCGARFSVPRSHSGERYSTPKTCSHECEHGTLKRAPQAGSHYKQFFGTIYASTRLPHRNLWSSPCASGNPDVTL